MSVVTGFGGSAARASAIATGRVVATFPTYPEAERAVDRLSDAGFPVARSAIVGRDLRLVEQVVGRLTRTSAAAMGAASGAWFGLFVGSVIGFFLTGPEWVTLLVSTVAIGAVWGAVFGFVAHWSTAGRRDFASASAVVADRYEVTVADGDAERAASLLSAAD
jgi:hypothetical protein